MILLMYLPPTSNGKGNNKLWKLLIDKKMNKQALRRATGISAATMAKLGKDEPVGTEVLLRICEALDCDFPDIVEAIKS